MDEKKTGRPPKNIDPNGTLGLFDSVSDDYSDTYNVFIEDSGDGDNRVPGPVGGGDASILSRDARGDGAGDAVPELTDDAILTALWREAHDRNIPAAARIQAIAKVQQARERMQGAGAVEDIPAELASFIALVKDKTPEECAKLV